MRWQGGDGNLCLQATSLDFVEGDYETTFPLELYVPPQQISPYLFTHMPRLAADSVKQVIPTCSDSL